MRLVGSSSPLSGTLLNLTLYPLLCALLIYVWRPRGEWRHDLPCVALVGSLSFAPGLVAHATQPLKDDVFTFLTVVAGVGAFLALRRMCNGSASIRPATPAIAGCAALLAAIYLAAGIRAYYAFFMLSSLAAVSLVFAAPWSWDRLRRRTPQAVVMLVLTGAAYAAGAGPYDVYLRPLFRPHALVAPANPSNLVKEIDNARAGFETSGVATNVVVEAPPPAPPGRVCTLRRQRPRFGRLRRFRRRLRRFRRLCGPRRKFRKFRKLRRPRRRCRRRRRRPRPAAIVSRG